ncbi:CPBP family intramembrane glutamic endopeptidase [Maricaulis parjimensis]|uniref:CPBP family intramembrane glutamic endopeptidase n=1 Tax=Maricaulis parjimensis TaxID=144023 RepID=UPI00193A0597|nr:type II CAAX endopeptidase family protein [Maricaulis parjimensis]
MDQANASLTHEPVRWPFQRRDVFYRVTEDSDRLAVIHSLPGVLVWPVLMMIIAYAFQYAFLSAWNWLGGYALPIHPVTASFSALVGGYACFALILWQNFKQTGIHRGVFSIIPLKVSEIVAGVLILIFMITIGGRLTLFLHEYAMADPSLTFAGGATHEELSNVDDFAMTGASVWAIIALTLIAAPIVEEVLFRGWMLPMMMARGVPAFFAIILSAAAFGIMHISQGLMVMISTFILGLALGLARVMTGRVAAPVLGHIANNAWAVFAVPALMQQFQA